MVSEIRKTWGGVFDDRTIMALYKLMNSGKISELLALIREGKESKVLLADSKAGKVAVKVYATEAANFKRMLPYLIGDPRFEKVKKDRRSIVLAWAKKEFKNLERAREAGVRCPRPLALEKNVLVMEFLGEDGEPAQRLSQIPVKEPEKLFRLVLDDMEKLWARARLVHGDLSEFNMVLWKGEPWMIDLSQAVVRDHPEAKELLKRDLKNICAYFKRLGVERDHEKLYEKMVGK
ncbi:MAG: serine protein kinase RIO [Candidatus Aenigmatarchaeota archaeon]